MDLRKNKPSGAVLAALSTLLWFSLAGCEGKDGSAKPPRSQEQVVAPAGTTNDSAAAANLAPVTSAVTSIRLERVFEPVVLSEPKTDPEWEPYGVKIEAFKISTFADGKYQGGDLLLVRVQHMEDGPCKGEGCEKPHYQHLRYVRLGKQMIFLPRISRRFAPQEYNPGGKRPQFLGKNPFEKFGFSLAVDADFTIPHYEYPERIIGDAPDKIIKLSDEEEGELDATRLVKIMEHPVFGGVYTSRPERSPANAAYSNEQSPGQTPASCYGASCFHTNAFFVFRPDGTLLKYHYETDFEADYSGYTFETRTDCSGTAWDHLAVVSPAIVGDTDLVQIGKTQRGQPVFGLRDSNHKLIHEFYAFYKKIDRFNPAGKQDTARLSLADFQAARPILFWRDPLGRLVRLTNTGFLPTIGCEPIIYLYPEKTQAIRVIVKPRGGVRHSTPRHREAWNVTADPQGRIRDDADGKTYPYLFWEGSLGLLPQQDKGFVVEKSQVATFFRRTLPQMGLNGVETEDFMTAWLPEFSQAPFYFITFFERDTIDAAAPLEITPRPDTVIRILMDYRPLHSPIPVEPLKLAAPPPRRGFVVIEWGGVKH